MIEFEAIADIGNNLAIAASNKFNGLFEVNLSNGECKFICFFPNEDMGQKRLYIKAVCVKDKVIFVPYAAKCIAIYNVTTQKIKMIAIKELEGLEIPKSYDRKNKFSDVVEYGNFIFMTPCTYPAMLKLDSETEEITYCSSVLSSIKFCFRRSPCVDGRYIYLPSTVDNIIFRFDMESNCGAIFHVGEQNHGTWSVCKVGDNIWTAPQSEGAVVRWNVKNNKVKEQLEYPAQFCGNGFLFTKIWNLENSLYLLPAYANMLVRIDMDTLSLVDSKLLKLGKNSVVYFLFELGEWLYLKICSDGTEKYMRLSMRNLRLEEYIFRLVVGKEIIEANYYLNTDNVIKEKNANDLANYIYQITK